MNTRAYLNDLSSLGMWQNWQNYVQQRLPHYAECSVYLDQKVSIGEIERVIKSLTTFYDPKGMLRDVQHGATRFETSIGPLTRAWLDANVEIDFLMRNMPLGLHKALNVLDIGAGYGRLAVMMSSFVGSYMCVDPVPISVAVCDEYTMRYAPTVRVLDIPHFVALMPILNLSLAINIHSWNECRRIHVIRWIDALEELKVPYLFTVTHDPQTNVYHSWEPENDCPDFKCILMERYDILAEECIGIGSCPHVLWRLK